MPELTFPDGRTQSYSDGITDRQIAEGISKGLAKKAIAIVFAGDQVLDLDRVIPADGGFEILTAQNDDVRALEVLRHSCAHLLAEAVCELYPGTRLAYGPAIETGFFYDLATPEPITDEALPKIEKKMAQIVKANRAFVRTEYSPADGLSRSAGGEHKAANSKRAVERGADVLSVYSTGGPG